MTRQTTTTAMFAASFTAPAVAGETLQLELDGFTITATIHDDPDASPPWENSDGHGPVSDYVQREKRPGELVLSEGPINSRRYYDFSAACKLARQDGWGADGDEGMTPRQKAAHAARADFAFLRRWCQDEWSYVGVVVTVQRAGVELVGPGDHAIWGVESEAAGHLTDLANERIGEALDAARAKVAELAQ